MVAYCPGIFAYTPPCPTARLPQTTKIGELSCCAGFLDEKWFVYIFPSQENAVDSHGASGASAAGCSAT